MNFSNNNVEILRKRGERREERGERIDVIDGEREKEILTMILLKLED